MNRRTPPDWPAYPPVPDGHIHDWQVASVVESTHGVGVATAVCLGCASFTRLELVKLEFRAVS